MPDHGRRRFRFVRTGPDHDVVFGPFAESGDAARVEFPTFLFDGERVSDVFFVAFPTLEPGDRIGLGALGQSTFLRQGSSGIAGTIVPEPGTGLLLGLGLAALARNRRRAR